MRRSVLVLVVVAALASVPVAGAVVGGSGPSASTTLHDANASNQSSVAPGQQLSGVVGVQGAELEGEVETRAAGLAIARAQTDDAKAAVVAGQFDTIEQRLTQLEQRKAALEAAHANGSLSDGAYRARMAELAARTEAVKHLANQTATVSERLPADLLGKHGVDASAIRSLSDRAGELSGPEVADIARSIAGPVVGAERVGGSPRLNVSVGADGNVSIDPPGSAPVGNGNGGSSDGDTAETTVTPTADDTLETNVTDDNETLDDTL